MDVHSEYKEYEKRNDCRIMITIEEQLEHYTICSNSTRRHQILWHAWKHNKEWLSKLLQWTLPSFPAYSMHDASHAESVLHNIEMLMGEKAIRSLSASDCFLILHMAYIHDIGMCITGKYRKKLLKSEEFKGFLRECENRIELKKYAKTLLEDLKELDKRIDKDRNYDDKDIKLDIYYSILYLVADYRRSSHGSDSNRMLLTWIEEEDKLGAGFSTSGIPIRFFYTIGTCAEIHNSSSFEKIMELPREDGGYAYDYMHPRLATVLLQLGDCLDLDNDRFHPVVNEFLDDIPESSKTHFRKHKSIRRLRISPHKITIHADCEKISELRLVRMEYEGIRDILRNAAYNWAAICPFEIDMVLPVLEPLVLMLKHEKVDDPDLANLHFYIQQDKAFNLLQGSNVYKDKELVFLREVLQNAVDATKIQYWKEWKGSHWRKEDLDSNFAKHISPRNYPIVICLHLAARIIGSEETILIDNEQELQKCKNASDKCEFGVIVRVRDYGTGISGKSLHEIADVGSSNHCSYEGWDLSDMPQWLQPTAAFGVGLQSVFLVTDSFFAVTHVRDGERYRIEFNNNARNNGNGYINVSIMSEEQEESKSYGTRFEIFIPSTQKIHYSGNMSTFGNNDPFKSHYRNLKDNSIRHELDKCRFMIMQMFSYLNSIIQERLFPIKIRIYDYDNDLNMYKGLVEMDSALIKPEIYRNKERVEDFGTKVDQAVTWTYELDQDTSQSLQNVKKLSSCDYMFDKERSKLYVADKKHFLYACLSAERFIAKRMHLRETEIQKEGDKTKVYYKGIYVKDMDFGMDMDMLEYLDIKETLNVDYLALNRSDFTREGEKYILDTIYPQILDYCREAIRHLGETEKDIIVNQLWNDDYFDAAKEANKKNEVHLKSQTKRTYNQPDFFNRIHRKILFWAGMGALLNTGKHVSYYRSPMLEKSEDNIEWSEMLDELSKKIQDNRDGTSSDVSQENSGWRDWSKSSLYNLPFYKLEEGKATEELESDFINIVDVLNQANYFIVVSHRSSKNATWEEILYKLPDSYVKKTGQLDLTGNFGNNIKDNILNLKNCWDKNDRQKLITSIESALEDVFERVRKHDVYRTKKTTDAEGSVKKQKTNSVADQLNQNLILTWVLDNVPSMAVYSNTSSTTRINFLDKEHTDSIYFNKTLRAIIYERMAYHYEIEHIQRFSTVVNTSYCQLGINESDNGVYYLKRGKIGKYKISRFIVPLTGEDISNYIMWLHINSDEQVNPDNRFLFGKEVPEEDEYIRRYCKLPIEVNYDNNNIPNVNRIPKEKLKEILKKDASLITYKKTKENMLNYVLNNCVDKNITKEQAETMYGIYLQEMLESLRDYLLENNNRTE